MFSLEEIVGLRTSGQEPDAEGPGSHLHRFPTTYLAFFSQSFPKNRTNVAFLDECVDRKTLVLQVSSHGILRTSLLFVRTFRVVHMLRSHEPIAMPNGNSEVVDHLTDGLDSSSYGKYKLQALRDNLLSF